MPAPMIMILNGLPPSRFLLMEAVGGMVVGWCNDGEIQ
jgi:hypothetical protein